MSDVPITKGHSKRDERDSGRAALRDERHGTKEATPIIGRYSSVREAAAHNMAAAVPSTGPASSVDSCQTWLGY